MDHQQFQDITYRYFRGQLSDDEYDFLTEHLQNPDNREYFEKTKLAWENQPELDSFGAQNLSRLQYKMNQKDTSKEPVIRQLWVRVASVAAILALGLLIGSTVTYLFSPETNQPSNLFLKLQGEKNQ